MLAVNNNSHTIEVGFVLRNIFIFSPNPLSKYKMRLVVRDHSEEQRISRQKQYYKFRFILESALREDLQDGEIYLLEKERYNLAKEYREIGIGKLDLQMCLQRQNYSTENQLINGLIYALNEGKSEKIIAKFSYKMVKTQQNQQINQFLTVQPNTVSRRKEKLLKISLRQSIIDKNIEIQNKLKDLTKQMDYTLKKDKQSGQKMKQLQQAIIETLKESALSYSKVRTYKYSEKMENLIQNSIGRCQLNNVSIKSIKICNNYYRKLQKLPLTSTHIPKIQEQIENKTHILMSFSQIFEQFHFRRKIIEIAVTVLLNETIHLQKDVNFYLPKTSKRIIIQVTGLQRSEKQVLLGYIQFSKSLNKIIELFNSQNQQKGYIVAFIDETACIQKSFMAKYRFQKQQHNKLMAQFKTKQVYQKKNSQRIEIVRRKSLATSSRLVQLDSPRHAQPELQQSKRYQFRKMTNPQFFGIKTNQSEAILSKSRIFTPKKSQFILQSGVKQYSIASSRSNQLEKGNVRLLNYSNSKRSIAIHQKLNLKSISLNIESPLLTNVRKLMLRLQLNNEIHLTKIYVSRSQQIQWKDIDLNFQTSITNDSKLRIGCYMKELKGGDSEYRQLGRCSISIQQMRNSSNEQCSIILTNSNKIIGKVKIKFNLNHSRVLQKVRHDQQGKIVSEDKRNTKTQQYQLSLDSSVAPPLGKSMIKSNRKFSLRKSQINSKINDF